VPTQKVEEVRGTSHHRAVRVEAIVVDEGVWESMKKAEAQALKKVLNLVSEAREDSGNRTPGVRLIIEMDRQRRIPKFEIEEVGPEQGAADDLDAGLAWKRGRGE
jgi:hypothetical protein